MRRYYIINMFHYNKNIIMSYAPIYSKLTDLDTRLSILELSAKSAPAPAPAPTPVPVPVPAPLPDYANTVMAPETAPVPVPESSAELSSIREDINSLLKDCSVNTSAINQLSLDIAPLATKEELATLATKEELVTLATKGEEFALATKGELAVISTLATKEELVTLATKEELATLATKEELVTLATKEELAEALAKFENIFAVLSQLNTKINEATDRIAALESPA